MVRARKSTADLRAEFQGGLVPGLSRPISETPSLSTASPPQSQDVTRRKLTVYIDDPRHFDLIDELLTHLRRHGLPRDNSMLLRALLDQAATALQDPARLEELARACQRTLPAR